jgi:hypothetical protein
MKGPSATNDEKCELPGSLQKFALHPLIHSFALGTIALHIGSGKKRRDCGLKCGR